MLLCSNLRPAEAWCIQNSPERVLPCRNARQIHPLWALSTPAYCVALFKMPDLSPSASWSPGSKQLRWLLHRCPLLHQRPPPQPALLLHPSPLSAPCDLTWESQNLQTQDGTASKTSLTKSWCFTFHFWFTYPFPTCLDAVFKSRMSTFWGLHFLNWGKILWQLWIVIIQVYNFLSESTIASDMSYLFFSGPYS